MKEKIGIEKLLELLNEYEKDGVNEFETYVERWYCERTYQILSGKWENSNELKPCEIISKRYGFIKWLVENDKINTESGPLYGFHFIMHNRQPYSLYETILMILAISDTPIEDLISYLR